MIGQLDRSRARRRLTFLCSNLILEILEKDTDQNTLKAELENNYKSACIIALGVSVEALTGKEIQKSTTSSKQKHSAKILRQRGWNGLRFATSCLWRWTRRGMQSLPPDWRPAWTLSTPVWESLNRTPCTRCTRSKGERKVFLNIRGVLVDFCL